MFFKCLVKEINTLFNSMSNVILGIIKKNMLTSTMLPISAPPLPHPHNYLKLPVTPFLCYEQSVRENKTYILTSKLVRLGVVFFFSQESNNRLFCYKTQPSRTLTDRILSFLPHSMHLGSSCFQILRDFLFRWFVEWILS